MNEEARKKQNQTLLLELFPTLRVRIEKVIADLEAQGLRPRIHTAWRSPAEQEKKFKEKKSLVRFGFHNVTAANGSREALAVDLVDEVSPVKSGTNYLLHLAAAAESAGLTTGIRWGELTEKEIQAIDAAIASQDWDAQVKIGWDPAHVEPTGITIEQAKAGLRPA